MKKMLIIASSLALLAGCSSMRHFGSDTSGTSGMSHSGSMQSNTGTSRDLNQQYQKQQQQDRLFNSYVS